MFTNHAEAANNPTIPPPCGVMVTGGRNASELTPWNP